MWSKKNECSKLSKISLHENRNLNNNNDQLTLFVLVFNISNSLIFTSETEHETGPKPLSIFSIYQNYLCDEGSHHIWNKRKNTLASI